MKNYILHNNNKIYYTTILSNRKSTCIQVKNNDIIIKTNKYTPKKYKNEK